MTLRNLTTFSLTELLVVMAILVVLAAVLFPVLVKARSNSDQATF